MYRSILKVFIIPHQLICFMGAPYKRIYKHSSTRGKEKNVICGFCGKLVPRYKTIPVYRSFGINDPVLRKEIKVMPLKRKVYVCPSCARHRRIVKIGKSRKSRPSLEE